MGECMLNFVQFGACSHLSVQNDWGAHFFLDTLDTHSRLQEIFSSSYNYCVFKLFFGSGHNSLDATNVFVYVNVVPIRLDSQNATTWLSYDLVVYVYQLFYVYCKKSRCFFVVTFFRRLRSVVLEHLPLFHE